MKATKITNFKDNLLDGELFFQYSWKKIQNIVSNIDYWTKNYLRRNYVLNQIELVKLVNDMLLNKKKIQQLNEAINKNKNSKIGVLFKQKKKNLISEYKILRYQINKIIFDLPNEVNLKCDKFKNKIIEEYLSTKKLKFVDYINKENVMFDLKTTAFSFGKRRYSLLPDGLKIYSKLLEQLRTILSKNKFSEFKLPLFISEENLFRSGQLPKFKNDLFQIVGHDSKVKYFLTPTAEVAFCSWLINKKLNSTDSNKFCSFSECFRREKIAYGKKNSGLLRLLQFSKMEMFEIATEENQYTKLLAMVKIVTNFFKKLDITYRVLLNSAMDTSWHCYITYDIEVFLPSLNDFVEVSSCSSTKFLQSLRCNLTFSDLKNKNPVMLNGSFLPMERVLAILLEYNINLDQVCWENE